MFGFLRTKSDITDETAMECYQNGDIKCFELLLARYNQRIFRFVLCMVYGDKTVAEDLLQEVFIKVIENKNSFDCAKNFNTWLYGLTRNHVIDYFRKEYFRRHSSLDRIAGNSDSKVTMLDQVRSEYRDQEELIQDKQKRDKLYEKLDEIRDEYREVFVLREFDGLKFDEIADITDTNLNTVKSRHRYAFRELREKLMETGYFGDLKDSGER